MMGGGARVSSSMYQTFCFGLYYLDIGAVLVEAFYSTTTARMIAEASKFNGTSTLWFGFVASCFTCETRTHNACF